MEHNHLPENGVVRPEESRVTGGSGLEKLSVISKLEVGPVRLEKRRLIAPYTVEQDGRRDSVDLIYRYEEDVFIPSDPSSHNLASMMAAQVALNYGLFCRQIEFRGAYDASDRRFLAEMAENTAREIFVKKFLEHNPFLTAEYQTWMPLVLDHYCRAELTFESTTETEAPVFETWPQETGRHAVLSSGGKDSLLTFGLLKEMGLEVHPIFINESGRHWFTALNAYRHFSAQVPHTARVWTNADRVFNWMIRRMPFIRSDYAQRRSDEYPIRLWTVAVFLFGALPLLKKRGISRLIIGDEFDTTLECTYHGIPHYNGLYDQSRFFDDALSGFFLKKNWHVAQFSILRPLSELLIEKMLVERYPDLQRYQTSCHATHTDKETVLPCGRCEKCRRIVGMLLGIGADPTRCGYTEAQVRDCIRNLITKGVHQYEEDAEHLVYLLHQKGVISEDHLGSVRLKERPNVMKLRFDPVKSPIESVPLDLRKPLYRIYLEHADGAVKLQGRMWLAFDAMEDPKMLRPYPYEKNAAETHANSTGTSPSEFARPYVLGELTWPEAQKRFEEVDVAILPVGSIEQHGPHLPVDTDAFDAEYLSLEVARVCSDPKPIVLPLMPYGVSYHHADFSGTISVDPETLSKVVYEIGMCVARQGITKLVIINGHGGNIPALHLAAQLINRDAHVFTCVDTGESSDADIAQMIETPNDVHAGEAETSTSLAIRPNLVRMSEARTFVPNFSSRFLNFSSKRSVGWYAHTRRLSPEGVLGDPSKATPEKGRKMWERMIQNLVELVEDLKSMTLSEIYQKRY